MQSLHLGGFPGESTLPFFVRRALWKNKKVVFSFWNNFWKVRCTVLCSHVLRYPSPWKLTRVACAVLSECPIHLMLHSYLCNSVWKGWLCPPIRLRRQLKLRKIKWLVPGLTAREWVVWWLIYVSFCLGHHAQFFFFFFLWGCFWKRLTFKSRTSSKADYPP